MYRSLRSLGLGVVLLAACTERGAATEAAPTRTDDKGAVAAAQPAEAAQPDAEKLLAESVEAMGGAARFEALKSFYSESAISLGGLGLSGAAKSWWRAGGDFLNETEMPGVGQMRVGSLGGKPWADDPISGLRTLSGKEAEQALWSATLCLACEWKRHFKEAKLTGVTEVEGRKLAEISLTSPLGDAVILRIDMASKLPASQSFTQVSPLGSMPATVHFKDFREVEGVKLPFEQMVDASLTKAVSTTNKIELNAAVEDAKFAMPGGRETVTPGALANPAKIETKPGEPAAPAKSGDKQQPAAPAKGGDKQQPAAPAKSGDKQQTAEPAKGGDKQQPEKR